RAVHRRRRRARAGPRAAAAGAAGGRLRPALAPARPAGGAAGRGARASRLSATRSCLAVYASAREPAPAGRPVSRTARCRHHRALAGRASGTPGHVAPLALVADRFDARGGGLGGAAGTDRRPAVAADARAGPPRRSRTGLGEGPADRRRRPWRARTV